MALKPGPPPRSWLESWTVSTRRCVRCILGVIRTVQWRDRLTTAELAGRFGMVESIGDLLTQWRLRWLGHVARMSDVRHPKRLLFGWFPQKRPAHGAKLRWRDKVRQDLKKCGITESSWYTEAQDRAKWKSFCQSGLSQHVMAPPLHKPFICNIGVFEGWQRGALLLLNLVLPPVNF